MLYGKSLIDVDTVETIYFDNCVSLFYYLFRGHFALSSCDVFILSVGLFRI